MKLTPSERVGRGLAAAKTAVRTIIVDSFKATYGASLYEQRILEAIQTNVQVINCTDSLLQLEQVSSSSPSSTSPTTSSSSNADSPSSIASLDDLGSNKALLNKKLISIGGPFEAVSKRMNLVTLLRILKLPVVWMICKSYATSTQSHSFVTFEQCDRIVTIFQQWSAQELDVHDLPSQEEDQDEDTAQQNKSAEEDASAGNGSSALGIEEENILNYCKQCIVKCFQFIYRLGYAEQAFKYLQEHQEFALTTTALSDSTFGASSFSLSAISTSSSAPLNIATSLTASFFTDSENTNALLMVEPKQTAEVADSLTSPSASMPPQIPIISNSLQSSHHEFKRVTYDFQPDLSDTKNPLEYLKESFQSLKENLELVLFGDQAKQSKASKKNHQVVKTKKHAAELATILPHQLVCKEQTYVMDEQMDLKQQFELRMQLIDFKVKKTTQKKKQQAKEQEPMNKSTGVSLFFN